MVSLLELRAFAHYVKKWALQPVGESNPHLTTHPKMTLLYSLYYEFDADQGSQPTYESEQPVVAGDVIRLGDGFWYEVTQVLQQRTRVRLSLSKSAQSPEEARLLASQLRSN